MTLVEAQELVRQYLEKFPEGERIYDQEDRALMARALVAEAESPPGQDRPLIRWLHYIIFDKQTGTVN